ncbi:hypothetical protein AAHA92_17393 [Salvia divinorum]|uniref:Uncharacterized protein n=1 Tax=Salvia divinorum TaxID=28513 RepID=A0ABD1H2N4_SALDI
MVGYRILATYEVDLAECLFVQGDPVGLLGLYSPRCVAVGPPATVVAVVATFRVVSFCKEDVAVGFQFQMLESRGSSLVSLLSATRRPPLFARATRPHRPSLWSFKVATVFAVQPLSPLSVVSCLLGRRISDADWEQIGRRFYAGKILHLFTCIL